MFTSGEDAAAHLAADLSTPVLGVECELSGPSWAGHVELDFDTPVTLAVAIARSAERLGQKLHLNPENLDAILVREYEMRQCPHIVVECGSPHLRQ